MSLETALQRIEQLTALTNQSTPATAAAPSAGPNPVFAQQLALAQSQPLEQPFGAAGPRALALAQRELGVTESPAGSNDGARIRDYRGSTAGAVDRPGPWCAYFTSWLAQGAGAPIGPGGTGLGYVPDVERWAQDNGRFYSGRTPQPGDLVVFQRNGADRPDHIGIVERIDPDGRVHTIEGNTSNSVGRRSYSGTDAQIRGYIQL